MAEIINNVENIQDINKTNAKKGRPKKIEDKKEYMKEYRKQNKEYIKKYYKNWLEKHNNNVDVVTCECGCKIVKCSISRHRKTKKHKKWEESKLIKAIDWSDDSKNQQWNDYIDKENILLDIKLT